MDEKLIEEYKKQMLDMKGIATETTQSQTGKNMSADIPTATTATAKSDLVGGLVVNVTTLDALYPVAGALVTVFTGKDGDREILDSSVSNESGRTKEFMLTAPQKEYSEESGYRGNTYSLYNVSIKADGFIEQIHYGIPVFSGVVSIKTADLISLSAAGKNTEPQVINEITDFNL